MRLRVPFASRPKSSAPARRARSATAHPSAKTASLRLRDHGVHAHLLIDSSNKRKLRALFLGLRLLRAHALRLPRRSGFRSGRSGSPCASRCRRHRCRRSSTPPWRTATSVRPGCRPTQLRMAFGISSFGAASTAQARTHNSRPRRRSTLFFPLVQRLVAQLLLLEAFVQDALGLLGDAGPGCA